LSKSGRNAGKVAKSKIFFHSFLEIIPRLDIYADFEKTAGQTAYKKLSYCKSQP